MTKARVLQTRAALQAQPAKAGHWTAYIDALVDSGDLIEASKTLELGRGKGLQGPEIDALAKRIEAAVHTSAAQRAAELAPSNAQACYAQGKTLLALGRPADAESSLRQATRLEPAFTNAHYMLGVSLQSQGRPLEARSSFLKAIELMPTFSEAHYNLGTIHQANGDLSDAEASYRKAIGIRKEFVQAHENLGVTLYLLDRPIEAIPCFERAISLDAANVSARVGLAAALQAVDRYEDAAQCARKAIELAPLNAAAHNNLGISLRCLGRLEEAQASSRRAVELSPDNASTLNNWGICLRELQRHSEATDAFQAAIAMRPDFYDAHYNVSASLYSLGLFDQAERSSRHAIDADPSRVDRQNDFLYALNYHPDKTPEEIYATYQEYDAQLGAPLSAQWLPHARSSLALSARSDRLRIGYVSPDFRLHAVGNFLEPLLAAHDHSRFEVFAYAELAAEDAATARYRGYCDHFILTRGMSDDALAARIRADGIDVLVDVAGHTGGNRLMVFARKPAPVSLSWMGYGYTTGLKAIDYFLIDEASAPFGSEHLFSETPWRLPCAYAYRPGAGMGEVSALPALSSGRMTFGTLTRSIRINHHTIRVWSEILKRVPGSVLLIDSRNFQHVSMHEAMAERFAEHGIGREQLQMGFHSPPWDTLRAMDIALDCFPHNSGTTLFEGLYMGVPFITLTGRPSVGRLGLTVLTGLGRQEWLDAWCAYSEEDYIAKAVALASDLPTLARIRAELRPTMQRSALMDEAGFARNVEQAYEQMFERWHRSQPQEPSP